jgi:serine/threonine protein kinase
MIKENFRLNPFGNGIIKQTLNQGQMFNIYLAELCGQEVCLKTPVISPRKGYYCSEYFLHTGSETFYSGNTWNPNNDVDAIQITPSDELEISMGMLLLENQIIQWTQGAWNHSTLGQGMWDGFSLFQDQNHSKSQFEECKNHHHVRFLPVMIMPYHQAIQLADLPIVQQRRLLPRMLPALWSALCKMYHGDLSETNILIQKDYSHFHLIDPGIILVSMTSGANNSSDLQDDEFNSVFTTTPANYPLLPPFDNASLFDVQSLNDALTLQDCLQILIRRNSFFSTPDLNSSAYGIFEMDARLITHLQQPPQRRSRPLPSDLLALGIIYYRMLTKEDLFLGREILPNYPAWQGDLPSAAYFPRCQDGSIYVAYQRVANALAENYIARELDKHDLSYAERQLVTALLNLEIQDQDHLLELTKNLS